MKTPVLQVHISSNLCHSGKSTLALIIKNALEAAGYTDVELTGTHNENYEHLKKSMEEKKLSGTTQLNNKVIINDVSYRVPESYIPFDDKDLKRANAN